MAEPTKQETDQVFKVLKAQKANKVGWTLFLLYNIQQKNSHVSTAMPETRRGRA